MKRAGGSDDAAIDRELRRRRTPAILDRGGCRALEIRVRGAGCDIVDLGFGCGGACRRKDDRDVGEVREMAGEPRRTDVGGGFEEDRAPRRRSSGAACGRQVQAAVAGELIRRGKGGR
jgi:hypothetical protein